MSEPDDSSTPHAPDPPAQPLSRRPQPLFATGDPVPNSELWCLREELGAGGFGQVWLATHQRTNESRAVKFCTHPVARERLAEHEKNVVLHVLTHMHDHGGDHPNVVPLLDCNLTGEIPWLMYEYVPGRRTLANVITEMRSLSPEQRIARALPILCVIARAVGRMHGISTQPIVHRDLKPANILMSGSVPRITDFGIGGAAVRAALSDSTGGLAEFAVALPTVLQGQPTGTLRYASPEQLLPGNKPDPRDDVFALGVIAYQMLVADLQAVPAADTRDVLQDLNVPAELVAIIVKSTSGTPARRHQDADALATELAAVRGEAGAPAVTRRVKILVPGKWLERVTDTTGWAAVGFTPGEIEFRSDRGYQFIVHQAITDNDLEGIRVLAGVPHFESLSLSHCSHLTDAGLGHLKALDALRSLDLNSCEQITDAGLGHLTVLHALRSLDLNSCERITDVGLEHLKSLHALQRLDLGYCEQITDAGIEHLTALHALQWLSLTWCRNVTDVGLRHLTALRALQWLSVTWCRHVTDAGLQHLAALHALRSLYLYSCDRATDAGIAALQRALPNCTIRN